MTWSYVWLYVDWFNEDMSKINILVGEYNQKEHFVSTVSINIRVGSYGFNDKKLKCVESPPFFWCSNSSEFKEAHYVLGSSVVF